MKVIYLIVCASIIFGSCDYNSKCLSKESFLNGYDKFSTDLKSHYRELEQSDWIDIDKEFKIYVEQCYPKFKKDLAIKERVQFWKHTLSYGVFRTKNDESYEMDLNIDFEVELEEMSEQGRKEIEDYIRKEIKPELQNVIDDVLKEVESFGEKLKKWLDEA